MNQVSEALETEMIKHIRETSKSIGELEKGQSNLETGQKTLTKKFDCLEKKVVEGKVKDAEMKTKLDAHLENDVIHYKDRSREKIREKMWRHKEFAIPSMTGLAAFLIWAAGQIGTYGQTVGWW